MTERTRTIGRDTFAYLHGFHFDDHKWSRRIPDVAQLETFERLVHKEHPKLLKPEIGNVE